MSLPETDEQVLVLHNPGCSKSRATVELLKQRGIAFEERRYLKKPLSRAELDELRRRLDLPPSEWIRSKPKEYAQSGLADDSSEAMILDTMAIYPTLMERPIVIRGGRARVGRPPEKVLELFEGGETAGAEPADQGKST